MCWPGQSSPALSAHTEEWTVDKTSRTVSVCISSHLEGQATTSSSAEVETHQYSAKIQVIDGQCFPCCDWKSWVWATVRKFDLVVSQTSQTWNPNFADHPPIFSTDLRYKPKSVPTWKDLSQDLLFLCRVCEGNTNWNTPCFRQDWSQVFLNFLRTTNVGASVPGEAARPHTTGSLLNVGFRPQNKEMQICRFFPYVDVDSRNSESTVVRCVHFCFPVRNQPAWQHSWSQRSTTATASP